MAAVTITRIAHASVLLDFDGETILTDPWFSEKPGYHHGEPYGVTLDRLPKLTGVIASHGHYDHFDMQSFRQYPNKAVPFVVKRGKGEMAAAARKVGFTSLAEVEPWETTMLGAVKVTALPAKHLGPEITYMLEKNGLTVYFGADTLLIPEHREIPARFPHIDVALLAVDGMRMRPMGNRKIVMDAQDAADLCAILRPRYVVPTHYAFTGGPFFNTVLLKLSSTADEFMQAVAQQAPQTTARWLAPGEPLRIEASAPASQGAPAMSMPATTRAIGITNINEPLTILNLPLTAPKAGQVVLRIAGAGVGRWDQYERLGLLGNLPLPRALGWEGSGTVEAVGAGVTDLAVGDPVIAYVRLAGFYADRVVVPAAGVARAPQGVLLADAAAIPIAASTAWQALVERANVQPGQVVVITAGAGGTGTYAIEVAKHLGAHVITTASAHNLDFVRTLGADEAYDYTDPGTVAAIRRAHPNGVDVLLDCVSADNWAPYATLVHLGGHAIGINPPLPDAPAGVERFELISQGNTATLAAIVALVDAGVLHIHVEGRYALTDAQSAQDHLATRHGRGRILLIP